LTQSESQSDCDMRALVLPFSTVALASAASLRDVPLGECHSCEALCFEDCTAQFYGEVIQADRRDYELKQRMLRENGGGSLSARGLAGVRAASLLAAESAAWHSPEQLAVTIREFNDCISQDKCATHPVAVATAKCPLGASQESLLEVRHAKCGIGGAQNQTCTQQCAVQAVGPQDQKAVATLLQKGSGFPHAPVSRGAFSEGKMTLDFCFKSCLAVTCGCSDAPGFSKISKLSNQIKKNDAHGEPVADTEPSWQYRAATRPECAGGIPGKKVNKGLWNNFGGGWSEVCTNNYMNSFFGPAYPGAAEQLKRCKSKATDDAAFGCSWNGRTCVAAMNVPSMPCFVRFKRDPTL